MLSSILNSNYDIGDFGQLESASEDKEGQEGGNISSSVFLPGTLANVSKMVTSEAHCDN